MKTSVFHYALNTLHDMDWLCDLIDEAQPVPE